MCVHRRLTEECIFAQQAPAPLNWGVSFPSPAPTSSGWRGGAVLTLVTGKSCLEIPQKLPVNRPCNFCKLPGVAKHGRWVAKVLPRVAICRQKGTKVAKIRIFSLGHSTQPLSNHRTITFIHYQFLKQQPRIHATGEVKSKSII